jgi:hypothetical protein
MGHDITVLAKHNLATSDIASLAQDLGDRLAININYGYMNVEPDRRFLGNTQPEGFILLGTIIKNPNFIFYRLLDNNYQTRAVTEKYAELYPYPTEPTTEGIYTPSPHTIASESHNQQFASYSLDGETAEGYQHLMIYDEIYQNGFGYFSRWWHLCRHFMSISDFKPSFDYLHDYRRTLQTITQKLNTDPLYNQKIYYLDDQSGSMNGVGQGSEYDMTWAELTEFVTEKTADLCVDIPRFFTDDAYKIDFEGKNEYPKAFFDDFRDL